MRWWEVRLSSSLHISEEHWMDKSLIGHWWWSPLSDILLWIILQMFIVSCYTSWFHPVLNCSPAKKNLQLSLTWWSVTVPAEIVRCFLSSVILHLLSLCYLWLPHTPAIPLAGLTEPLKSPLITCGNAHYHNKPIYSDFGLGLWTHITDYIIFISNIVIL